MYRKTTFCIFLYFSFDIFTFYINFIFIRLAQNKIIKTTHKYLLVYLRVWLKKTSHIICEIYSNIRVLSYLTYSLKTFFYIYIINNKYIYFKHFIGIKFKQILIKTNIFFLFTQCTEQ